MEIYTFSILNDKDKIEGIKNVKRITCIHKHVFSEISGVLNEQVKESVTSGEKKSLILQHNF